MRRRWPWLILVIVVATLGAASTGDLGLVRLFKLRAGHERLMQENSEIRSDNDRLRTEVRNLREDRFAIEKIAREELGMVRKDEVLYKIHP
jgi:cell division protein FtsB